MGILHWRGLRQYQNAALLWHARRRVPRQRRVDIASAARVLEHYFRYVRCPVARAQLTMGDQTRCKFPKQSDEPVKGPSFPKSQRHAQERHTVFMIGFDQFVAIGRESRTSLRG